MNEDTKKAWKAGLLKYGKWVLWIAIALLLYYAWSHLNIADWFISLLQKNDALWSIYKGIGYEVESKSLTGLFYASSLGALWFISLPVEVIFLFYLGLNYNVFSVIAIVLVGNLLGIIIDYLIGLAIGEKIFKWMMKKKFDEFKAKINRAGAFLILIGNIIPFPIEIFTTFLGTMKYNFKKLMIYTAIGKFIKFIILYLGYVYFIKFLSPYLSNVSFSWFINLVRSAFF